MPQEMEIEFKQLLTKATYEKMIKYYQMPKPFRQENHYFETADMALREAGAALRIRVKTGSLEFTLKQPSGKGLLETNQQVSAEAFEALKQSGQLPEGETAEQLCSFLGFEPSLKWLGSLVTDRTEKRIPEGLLVFDKSMYAGTTDYELEFEAASYEEGKLFFENFLVEWKLSWNTPDNKIRRFYRAAYEQL
ncbi:CYTH domain-containing protein [Alkalicoccus luteus]|uniref:CYTH domain-containing protein n=1 Tax=Alkalicoccus luteus TaxID=1237094 RepID=A0A969TWK8_9BACI|nr:CYTH domain-containing protein [Alkalicoccus luteus]NJP39156.1 CYTH domain-containing protein [Alkalicoccus luteus]